MHVYYARKGLKLWNGKERLAQFIPIGEGMFSHTTTEDEMAEKLEKHPFYKGELTKPNSIALKIPTIKEKVMIERAVVKDKDGKELHMPVEILLPIEIDSFYKAIPEMQIKAKSTNIVAGPMTSVNSAQGEKFDEAETAKLMERLEEIKPLILTSNDKIKVGAPSHLIEEYYKIKGKLE